jgi:hypothetical protein
MEGNNITPLYRVESTSTVPVQVQVQVQVQLEWLTADSKTGPSAMSMSEFCVHRMTCFGRSRNRSID